jgi:hypothetical protein
MAPDVVVHGVRQADPGQGAERNRVAFRLGGPRGEVAVELHLQRCPEPPRPAWIEVNGRRIDRRIGAGYAISFAAGGKEVKTPDPLRDLVYRFAALLRDPQREPIAALAASADARLRLFARILGDLAAAS